MIMIFGHMYDNINISLKPKIFEYANNEELDEVAHHVAHSKSENDIA